MSPKEVYIQKNKINKAIQYEEIELEESIIAFQKLQKKLKTNNQHPEATAIYIDIFHQIINTNKSLEEKLALIQQYKVQVSDSKAIAIYNAALAELYIHYQKESLVDKYYQLAIQELEKHENYTLLVQVYTNIAVTYFHYQDFKNAKTAIDNAALYLSSIQQKSILTNTYNYLGVIYLELNQPKIALNYILKQSELLKDDTSSIYSSQLAGVYNNLAACYQYLHDNNNALIYFQKLLKIDTHPLDLALTNYNIGTIYKALGKIEKAKKHLKYSLKYIKEGGIQNPYMLEDYINSYLELSNIFLAENKIDSAIFFMKKAKKHQEKTTYRKAIGHHYHSQIYLADEKYFLAKKELNLALEERIRLYGQKHNFVQRTYLDFSKISSKEKKYQEALRYCQLALEAGSIGFSDITGASNPSYKNTLDKSALIDILYLKLQTMQALEEEKVQSFTLEDDYQTAALAVQALEQLNRSFQNKDSKKHWLNTKAIPTFETAIKIAIKGYHQTKDLQYLDKAFQFSEHSKSMLMMEALQESNATSTGGLPDSLVQKEKELKKSIGKTEKAVLEARLLGDKKAEKQQEDILFLYQSKLNALKNIFETQYPKYHQLKYESNIANIADVQQTIDASTLLVEYFEGEENIYIFSISKKDQKVSIVPKDKNYNSYLKKFLNNLSSINETINDLGSSYNDFCRLSHYFHKRLLGTHILQTNKTRLIIIPDGQIAYLPFEVLLSKEIHQASKDNVNFKTLPYLLRDYKVNYNYSATLLLQQKLAKNTIINGDILAMAASYSLSSPACRKTHETTIREKLTELPGALQEVKVLSQYYQGLFLSANDANETTFKENASKYGVIHLAMHGIVNSKQSDLSSLVFTENESCAQDNFLYAYEIKQQNLKAGLVVLSACETGIGKYQNGEGIVSIGRGFMYAGSPSLMMTLWVLNDQTGAYVVQAFYENLKNGMEKDEALHQAKIAYINNVSGTPVAAHPFFWAAFVQLGDYSSISINTKSDLSFYIIGSLFLFGILGIGFLVRWKK